MSRFLAAIARSNILCPPVWLMRQAGRYHSHYQALRARHSFVELCKRPELACETTLGPIRDFDFDAAILFSDILFPLEVMGMGLEYEPKPRLSFALSTTQDLERLRGGRELASGLSFQSEALRRIRSALPPERGLIGFVGGPLTLYFYATAGSHQAAKSADPETTQWIVAQEGFGDGRFEGFTERLIELLAQNMADQARAGADCIAMLDTAAGEIDDTLYRERVLPVVRQVMERYESLAGSDRKPLVYYTKGTSEVQWDAIVAGLPIACLGVDWMAPISRVLARYSGSVAVQGNFNPHLLRESPPVFERALEEYLDDAKRARPSERAAWVMGLGHGVLPQTPEAHVRRFVTRSREIFGDRVGQS